MAKHSWIIFPLFLTLVISGCGLDRDQADRKLEQACTAAIPVVLGPDDTFEVQGSSFESAKSVNDTDLRVVHLQGTYTKNHGLVSDKEYTCTIEEISDFFGYSATFYNMEVNGKKFGNFDGKYHGDMNTMMKVTDSFTKALK